ncbi:hypothetical protein, partial [Sediminibacterium sp.]|uniref:hypothetical protein n=1 Tax=Sediminibacterium sp. TaxID=1917865 RepID=UPI003F6A0C3E
SEQNLVATSTKPEFTVAGLLRDAEITMAKDRSFKFFKNEKSIIRPTWVDEPEYGGITGD